MNDILMTNIFFMITAIASVIITILLSVALVYLIKFVRRIHQVTQTVQEETVKVIGDVEEVRGVVRQHLTVAKNVASATFVTALVEKVLKRNKK